MPRPYGRIDQDLDDDPVIAAMPSDLTRYAWVQTLLRGKKVGGRWESRAHWAAAIGRQRRRQLQLLIDAKLMEELPSGAVRVPPGKWKAWQVDPTGVDRQRRHREKQSGEGDADVTPE